MGKWYVVEVLEHKVDPQKPISGSYIVDSCPIVKLRALEYSSLRLLWTEEAGNLEYTFRIPDISRKPGVWISSSQQNGKFVALFVQEYYISRYTPPEWKFIFNDLW